MKEDLNNFEKLLNKQQIFKETEKAIMVRQLSVDNAYRDDIIWIPKSAAKIEGKFVTEIKGWFANKCLLNCYWNLTTAEAQERINKMCEKYEKKVC